LNIEPSKAPPVRVATIAELQPMAGREIAVSDWLLVSQAMIDEFAEATNDRQWIHVDVARAAKESPGGKTIAHGFLVVSLFAPFFEDTIQVGGTSAGINYGFNKLRFTAPVASGSRIRARFTLTAYEEVKGGAQLTWSVTIEREGEEKPAIVAEWLMRRYV
jgi:acyl dehydratase